MKKVKLSINLANIPKKQEPVQNKKAIISKITKECLVVKKSDQNHYFHIKHNIDAKYEGYILFGITGNHILIQKPSNEIVNHNCVLKIELKNANAILAGLV